jgi:hypothetical protein
MGYMETSLTVDLRANSNHEKISLTNGCPASFSDGGAWPGGTSFMEHDASSTIPASWQAPIHCRTPRVPEPSWTPWESCAAARGVHRALSVLPESQEEADERGKSPSVSRSLQHRGFGQASALLSDVSPPHEPPPSSLGAGPGNSITLQLPSVPSAGAPTAHTPPLLPSESPEMHPGSIRPDEAVPPPVPVPVGSSLTLPLPNQVLTLFNGNEPTHRTIDEDASTRMSSHRTSVSHSNTVLEPAEHACSTAAPVPTRLTAQSSFPKKPRTSFRSARGPGPPRPSFGLHGTRSLQAGSSSSAFAAAAAAAVAAESRWDDGAQQALAQAAVAGAQVSGARWRDAAAASGFSRISHGRVSRSGGAGVLNHQASRDNVMEMSWCAFAWLILAMRVGWRFQCMQMICAVACTCSWYLLKKHSDD